MEAYLVKVIPAKSVVSIELNEADAYALECAARPGVGGLPTRTQQILLAIVEATDFRSNITQPSTQMDLDLEDK